MSTEQFKEHLMKFDLTRQEAALYESLLENGKLTGYEVAKLTGISRSNVYASLASLCEKGAAYLEENETGKKYLAVPVQEVCEEKRPSEKSRRKSLYFSRKVISGSGASGSEVSF